VHEYDLIADWYVASRSGGGPRASGVPEVSALVASLTAGASVVDLGCGPGLPLTQVLLEHGLEVLGVDSSERMLEHFRRNFPNVPTLLAPIEDCDFGGRLFDAALAWGVMFHLSQEAQVRAIANVATALKAGGCLLFTSGDVDGSIQGEPMNGVPFRYHSFSVEGYRELLRTHGLVLEETHTDAGENRYYLARRRG
jgi:SAM-dependent methyltransferase